MERPRRVGWAAPAATQARPVHRHDPSDDSAGFQPAPSHHQYPSGENVVGLCMWPGGCATREGYPMALAILFMKGPQSPLLVPEFQSNAGGAVGLSLVISMVITS